MDIKNYISESVNIKNQILNNNEIITTIQKTAELIINAYKTENKILIAGNGGSAADAQHIAAELVGKFKKERKALNAIALNTNTSILTAIGNDFSFNDIFARQIEAYGKTNDIFLAISTSGNSENIIKAIKVAKAQNIKIVGLTGQNPSSMDNICDYIIKVPSNNTPQIQETHIMLSHIICGIIEEWI